MVWAVWIVRQILSAPSIATFSKRELVPGSSIESEADVIADIRHRAETIYHPVGTCRMGRDPHSVVEPALRVRGVEGLRVVDASIKIGRASCRERVCQSQYISVVARPIINKKFTHGRQRSLHQQSLNASI